MSGYTVVARRYRPRQFDELIGQDHVARALQQAITRQRVGHAYLFTGGRGVGKTSAARILAKALNCSSGPTPNPCDQCDICSSIAGGTDMDVLEIDGASNRGIDEIRELRQNASIRPGRARFKIYTIDEVHMLTTEAFNALLKTLEEPPEHVKFIFATTEPNKIPITILSRCQRFDFAGIGARAIQQRLEQIAEAEGVRMESAAIQILASRAAGSMRDSQSLLEQLLAACGTEVTAADVSAMLGLAPAERLDRLVVALVGRDAAGALAEVHEALAGGVEVGQLTDQLVGYFRDVMAAAAGCPDDCLLHVVPGGELPVRQVAGQLGMATILAICQILDQASSRMRLSLNARTLLEMAVVRIAHLEDLDDLAALASAVRAGLPAEGGGGTLPAGRPPSSPAGAAAPRTRLTGGVSPPAIPPAAPPPAAPPPASPPRSGGEANAAVAPAAGPGAAVADDLCEAPPVAHGPASEDLAPSRANGRQPSAGPQQATAGQQAKITPPWDDDRANSLWQSMVMEMGDTLASNAAHAAKIQSRRGNEGTTCEIVASFPEEFRFDKERCEKADNRVRLESILTELAGHPVRIDCSIDRVGVAGVSSAPPAAGAAPSPSRRTRRQLRAELENRPFVKRAMELFDADPDKIRHQGPGISH